MARALADHVAPGRGADARLPNEDEFRQTMILAVPIDEASAKVRTGPPKDDADDLGLPVWAGILPLGWRRASPSPTPRSPTASTAPSYVTDYRRPTA